MQISDLIQSVDLTTVFERTGQQSVSTHGRWQMYRCPCHADRHPSLAIAPDRRHWVCFGRCNTSGDALDWLQLRLGLDLKQARAELETLASGGGAATKVAVQRMSLPSGPVWPSESAPPSQRWQRAARRAVQGCEDALWSDRGQRARAWLNQRGLDNATLRYWRVGFNAAPRRFDGLFVSRGIVIPCIERGQVWSLKVRRATGHPKYVHVVGSHPALFGASTLARRSVCIITEGEFDAMLVHRFAGDLVSVVTLGSASTRLAETWLTELLPIKHVLVAYDADAAGAHGAAFWQALSARVRRAILPTELHVKDLTDFWLAGGDLRQWLHFEIRRHFGSPAESSPNSLPTLALGFREINPSAVSGAVSPEGAPHEHDGHA